MKRQGNYGISFYSEFCPACTATMIGIGLICMTFGATSIGIACVVGGISLGIISSSRSVAARSKISKKR